MNVIVQFCCTRIHLVIEWLVLQMYTCIKGKIIHRTDLWICGKGTNDNNQFNYKQILLKEHSYLLKKRHFNATEHIVVIVNTTSIGKLCSFLALGCRAPTGRWVLHLSDSC